MEEDTEEPNVVPELYFLIAKFLNGGPFKETAKTLIQELNCREILPRRIDWEGNEHKQSFEELESQFPELTWQHLSKLLSKFLSIARVTPSAPAPEGDRAPGPTSPSPADEQPPPASEARALSLVLPGAELSLRLQTRLSLLSEALVRPRPAPHSPQKEGQALPRRLMLLERGCLGGRGGAAGWPLPVGFLRGMRLQRRTLGHLSAVYCVAFDPRGRFVFTGADDLLVKVWAALDGRLLGTLRGAGAEITDLSVGHDGALLAAGSVDKLVRVWRLDSGAPAALLAAHSGTVTSVHWAPLWSRDTRWLASTATDGSVAFWCLTPLGELAQRPVQFVERLRPGVCHMICSAWSSGGLFLAAGSADQHVRVYQLGADGEGGEAPARVLEVAAHAEAVDSLAWAHEGARFVSASKAGPALLWRRRHAQWRHTPLVAPAPADAQLKVSMVCWDRSDDFIVTAVSDFSLRVWCSKRAALLRSVGGPRGAVFVLEPHPVLRHVAMAAGHDGRLLLLHLPRGEVLARFHNQIAGQGDGAIFDAKWSADGLGIAATDSHGHLLLFSLGEGHPRLRSLPPELFFHSDYRALARDAHGHALDALSDVPPHLLPPPFLVDVEGAPYPAELQRLVPGREALALPQLTPARAPHAPHAPHAQPPPPAPPSGVWRGSGVRRTGGSWLSADLSAVPACTRPMVPPLGRAELRALREACEERYANELQALKAEARRRPLMISTGQAAAPRRHRAKPTRRPRAPPPARPEEEEPEPDSPESQSDSSDSSVRLSHSFSEDSADRTSNSSSSYSDWEGGGRTTALAPPARTRRRPRKLSRYSPGANSARKPRAAPGPGPAREPEAGPGPGREGEPSAELPERFRPGEWLTAVSPRKAPYHPQMGDDCLYFRIGHERYFEAVSQKDVYALGARDRPWDRASVYECEIVKVVGVKYVIKPPRVACLKLQCALEPSARSLAVRYHDMADVIDFLLLRQHFRTALQRNWAQGDRFRCMIDDSWWTGEVVEAPPCGLGPSEWDGPAESGPEAAAQWASRAAATFLSVLVRWDNSERERLSPWDLEPLDPERLPREMGGAVAVLPGELEAVLYRPSADEWAGETDHVAMCKAIADHIQEVMSLSVAEPFCAPVDLAAHPTYALTVPYPVDLSTIRARFSNLFYRRLAAAQFDARYIAHNAELFNERGAPVCEAARKVSALLLRLMARWRRARVILEYRHLCQAEGGAAGERDGDWRRACSSLLRELSASADALPFLAPVSELQAPGYSRLVPRPVDLGAVARRLASGAYAAPHDFAADVRDVFHNSRIYNTNKRSRIYSMTVRLSALFEALYAKLPLKRAARGPRVSRRSRRTRAVSEEAEVEAGPSLNGHASPPPARDSSPPPDSDSDAPLTMHAKGKGVGKRSVSRRVTNHDHEYLQTSPWDRSGQSSAEARRRLSPSPQEDSDDDEEDNQSLAAVSRKRRRMPLDSGSDYGPGFENGGRQRRRRGKLKRTRERFAEASSSSSSSSTVQAEAEAQRYESDRSYRPRYSSEDDTPLNLYRERRGGDPLAVEDDEEGEEEEDEAEEEEAAEGEGEGRRNGVARVSRRLNGHVKLRSVSAVRYNEESEDETAAAIPQRRRLLATPHHSTHQVSRSNGAGPSRLPPQSVSSRGRVRTLTAKARHLLQRQDYA